MPDSGDFQYLLAAAAGVIALMVLRRRPDLGVSLWVVTLAFVPIWISLPIPLVSYPACQVGILVLVALVPLRGMVFGVADLLAAMLLVACLAPLAFGGATLATVTVVVAQWGVAFAVGRFAPSKVDIGWIYGCVAVVFTVVAVLAIVEFIAGWNPFVGLGPNNSLHRNWETLQLRGGVVRAEGAFGHSIALGSSLALAIPLTLASRFRSGIRIVLVLLMLAAVAVTVSRVSIVGAILATALVVVFVQKGMTRSLRAGIIGVLLAGGVAAIPWILSILDSAGQEAAGSAGYRSDLTSLIPSFSPIGLSSAANRTPTGELYFGRFRSIDSQLILTGLTYGWLTLIVASMALICAVVATLRLRASVGTVAIVAQIPALATVAFITQYSVMFWFVAGLAVAGQVVVSRPDQETGPPEFGDGERVDTVEVPPPVKSISIVTVSSPRRAGETAEGGRW